MSEELLIRFLTKTCTQEELVEVERWISVDHANADWLFGLEGVWSLKDELHFKERKEIAVAYQRLIRTISPIKQAQEIKWNVHRDWLKYAAAIIIMCLLATNIYQAFRNKPLDELTSNTIEVPIGQRVVLTLADKTKVWLNSGSTLSYPTNFDDKNRIVRLNGEGYFEVTTNKEHPFVVQTTKLDIKALGTKFNVQAYTDDDVEVSLLEGQLHIQAGTQTALMVANDLVTWTKTSNLVHLKNRELNHTTQWISGELMFVDESLTDIAKVLERHFSVTIIIDTPELREERFTCRTQPEPTLEQVLNLLKKTKKLDFFINKQTVHIHQ